MSTRGMDGTLSLSKIHSPKPSLKVCKLHSGYPGSYAILLNPWRPGEYDSLSRKEVSTYGQPQANNDVSSTRQTLERHSGICSDGKHTALIISKRRENLREPRLMRISRRFLFLVKMWMGTNRQRAADYARLPYPIPKSHCISVSLTKIKATAPDPI